MFRIQIGEFLECHETDLKIYNKTNTQQIETRCGWATNFTGHEQNSEKRIKRHNLLKMGNGIQLIQYFRFAFTESIQK